MVPCPPHPKTFQNTTRTWGLAAKKILTSSRVQCALFVSIQRPQKNHACQRVRWSNAHRMIVNKIKNLLVSLKKVASMHCNDYYRSRNVRRSHSPVKLEPPGAGGLGGPWWQDFCLFLVFCCVLLHLSCTMSLWEKGSIRPLVSGPATDKSKPRI